MSIFQDYLNTFDPTYAEQRRLRQLKLPIRTYKEELASQNPAYTLPTQEPYNPQNASSALSMKNLNIPFSQRTGKVTTIKETIDEIMKQTKERLGLSDQEQSYVFNYLKSKADSITGGGEGKLVALNPSIDNVLNSRAIVDAYNHFLRVSKFHSNQENVFSDELNNLTSGDPGTLDQTELKRRIDSLASLKELLSNPEKYGIKDLRDKAGELPDKFNFTPAVQNYSNLLSSRIQEEQGKTDIRDYLNSLPELLRGKRESFLKGERERAIGDYNRYYVPQALASENEKGTLFSGTVPDVLSQGAISTQSALEQQQADLEAQDNQFYFNSAYQAKINELLNKNINLKDFLTSEKQNVLDVQQQQFEKEQNILNQNLDYNLAKRGYQRDLYSQQSRLQRRRQLEEQQNQGQLYRDLGSSAGTGLTVAGLATANPVLTTAGYGISTASNIGGRTIG